MENTGILGEYDFRNITSINFWENDEEEINSTILHETMHMLLTKRTKWGFFSYCIRRIKIYDYRFNYLLDLLCYYSKNVQECVAVFSQCIYAFNQKGYAGMKKHVEYLENYNEEYYTYLKPLLCYLSLLEKNIEGERKLTSYNLHTFICLLAMISLNLDLTKIDLEVLKNEELMNDKFSNKQEQAMLPDYKFQYLAEECYKLIEKNEIDSLDLLISKFKESNLIDKQQIEEYLNGSSNQTKAYEKYLIKLKKYLKQLYADSENVEKINTFLDIIELKKVSIKDLAQYCIPTSFNMFDQVKSDFYKIRNLCTAQTGILFYLGNLSKFKEFDSDMLYLSKNQIKCLKASLKQEGHAVLFYNYYEKKIHSALVTAKELEALIKKSNNPVIVNYKYYSKQKNGIKGINSGKKEIYFYCDRAYPNSVDLINKGINGKAMARIVEYGNMYLLTIRFSPNCNYLLYFLPIAYPQVISDIRSKKLNVKFADNPDGITIYDNIIFTSEEVVSKFDLITNCLFSTSP